jgi:hypothetical protein
MHILHIIDTLGVFVEPTNDKVVNWSKVNFSALEQHGRLPVSTTERIVQRFAIYVKKVKSLGYDSLSFDDLAHMTAFDWYNPDLKLLLNDYQQLYKKLFAIAKKQNMRILVNTDYLFYNEDIRTYMQRTSISDKDFFAEVISQSFATFPEIDGIILRIGENDGKDVQNTFLSKLTIRTANQAHQLLKTILPVFEKANKTLVFRTWTVGVYPVGDLIWNQYTFDTVFESIQSPSLVISMKFGDTDFMKYLALNPLLLETNHQKIIELQTRREWEGMGMYPSFVGWDYQKYLNQISHNKTIIGVHVWCQTGGWAKQAWTNVTFIDKSSFWVELNTYVTIHLYRHGNSVDDAITSFCRDYGIKDIAQFTQLLVLSETAIKQGLYIQEFAQQPYYFRRSRIPTLFWFTWDTVLLQPIVVMMIRTLVKDHDAAIRQSEDAVVAIEQMIVIAKDIQLKQSVIESLEFQLATFVIFAELKKYLFGRLNQVAVVNLQKNIDAYTRGYPQHYTIPKLDGLAASTRAKHPLKLVVRQSPTYRKRDKILLATSPIQHKLATSYLRMTKSPLGDQSMGIDVLFK